MGRKFSLYTQQPFVLPQAMMYGCFCFIELKVGANTVFPCKSTNPNLPFSSKIKYLGCANPVKQHNSKTNLIIFIIFIFANLLKVKICSRLSPKFFVYANRHLSPFY